MKLTAPPRKGAGAPRAKLAATTTPGFCNPNRQEVMRATGSRSTSHWNQSIYRLRCALCRHEYGCNGSDIHNRLCPACQGGQPGEPVAAEQPLPLFG